MEIKKYYADVLVVGGGASGLVSAVSFARRGLSVLLLEKNERVGKKLLQTGGGRCNISHAPLSLDMYHGDVSYAKRVFARFNEQYGDVPRFLRSFGIFCRTDEAGRVYPYSNSASGVVDAFRLEATRLGVQTVCGMSCVDVAVINGGYLATAVETAHAYDYLNPRELTKAERLKINYQKTEFRVKTLVMATGGMAAPSTGSGGDGYALLQKLGHTVVKPMPVLCPVKTSSRHNKFLKGVRVHARCSAVFHEKVLKSEYGEVQFTETGLSGICIFNLARYVAMYKTKLLIALDLFPDIEQGELQSIIAQTAEARRGEIPEHFLSGMLPKRVGLSLLKELGLHTCVSADEYGETDFEKIAALAKKWCFTPAEGVAEWNAAQCTMGGIPAAELGFDTESKLHKRLYVKGELINVDGDCGGFNLAWAIASAAVI